LYLIIIGNIFRIDVVVYIDVIWFSITIGSMIKRSTSIHLILSLYENIYLFEYTKY